MGSSWNLSVLRLVREIAITVARLVTIVWSKILLRSRVGAEIEDVSAKPIEVARGELPGPKATHAMILVRSNVELPRLL